MLKDGYATTLIFELAMCVALAILVRRGKHGEKVPVIHKIPGLEAIDEAVGRATELGRPVLYVPGRGNLQDAQTFASLAILDYTAAACAQYDTRIIVPTGLAVVQPVASAVVQQAYVGVGKGDRYTESDVRFINEENWPWAIGIGGIIMREQVAATILIGAFWAESLFIAEIGSSSGAMQIAGSASIPQIPFFVASCDYTLIGEEIYAASAYLNPDPITTAGLIVQDWGKMVGMVLVLVGSLLVSFGSNWLLELVLK